MDEDFDSLVLECTNCHLKFYAPELKMNPLTNELVCANCFSFPGSKITILKDRITEKKKAPALFRPSVMQQPKKEAKKEAVPQVALPPGYALYYCEDCRYSFSRNAQRFNNICPYCSRQRVKVLKRSAL